MAEFTGERIIPGQVDPDLWNEHLARYAFAARLARGKRVLDAGCGSGYGSAELAKSALSVTGLDCSWEAVSYAAANYQLANLRIEQASCSALPHPDAAFDLVVAFEVIEHLSDWRVFLTEVRRVLDPAGQFILSTPNKSYYAESRSRAGPNPFHVHEFEYAEFRDELSALFPYVSFFLENHVGGVVFQPLEGGEGAEARIDAGQAAPADAHFFVALCAGRPQTGPPAFVYVPRAANLLRERERHIGLLESELQTKNEWLDQARQDLAALNEQHQKLLAMFRDQKIDLDQANQWALRLNAELEAAAVSVQEFQAAMESYQTTVAGLEQENVDKTEWARENERRLEEKTGELAQCVELLHQAENTVEERTHWAGRLQTELQQLEQQLGAIKDSRWVKLGARMGLGPNR